MSEMDLVVDLRENRDGIGEGESIKLRRACEHRLSEYRRRSEYRSIQDINTAATRIYSRCHFNNLRSFLQPLRALVAPAVVALFSSMACGASVSALPSPVSEELRLLLHVVFKPTTFSLTECGITTGVRERRMAPGSPCRSHCIYVSDDLEISDIMPLRRTRMLIVFGVSFSM